MTTAASTAYELFGTRYPGTSRTVSHVPRDSVRHRRDQESLSSSTAKPAMSFGPFCLLPDQRLLLEAGRPRRVGSRAFDILRVLMERPGQLVEKGELMARVWPNTFVDESNLRVHVSALRKILGDDGFGRPYVVNVSGRGYVFVAPVR